MVASPKVAKRQKEKERLERRRAKEQKRQQRRLDRAGHGSVAEGEDPDVAGIIPGPQPLEDG